MTLALSLIASRVASVRHAGVEDYAAFDVLADEELRQGESAATSAAIIWVQISDRRLA